MGASAPESQTCRDEPLTCEREDFDKGQKSLNSSDTMERSPDIFRSGNIETLTNSVDKKNRFRNSRPPRLNLRSLTTEVLRSRTTSSMWDTDGLDPFQVFEVEHESCLDFTITIHRGEGITKGSLLQDYIDTPDPYVILKVPGSSNSSKRTTQLDNTTVPLWEETFHFYLDPTAEHILHVTLMDANITLDETLGEDTFIVNTLTNDVPVGHVFLFPGGSKVYATLLLTKNKNPDLRFSLALCEQEREFLQIRRQKVLKGLHALLGDRAPDTDKQVPIMAVLGSGGGFRAMMCLSGAVKALHETGVLDCATYISGLSGSSWYISNLYSHGGFPGVSPEVIQEQLRQSVTSDWKWKLTNSLGYVTSMLRKYRDGQPISFTDFFGHLLGDVLLKERKNIRLTDQRRIVAQGTVPFPLYTCLHAKRSVSCKAFSEWVEFSPYEIGIAKYGTFMKTEHFGSKFMVGKLIKQHPESPLHFLQGVWGSAFTVLIKRLVLEGSNNKDMVQMMREDVSGSSEREIHEKYDEELKEQLTESDTEDEDDIVGKDDDSFDDEYRDCSQATTELPEMFNHIEISTCEDSPDGKEAQNETKFTPNRKTSLGNLLNPLKFTERKSQSADVGPKKTFIFDFSGRKKSKENSKKLSSVSDPGSVTEDADSDSPSGSRLQRKGAIKGSAAAPALRRQSRAHDVPPLSFARSGNNKWTERRKTRRAKREQVKAGLFSGLKESLMTSTNMLNSRAGRAGEILNPFRGLSLRNSFPISPFADVAEDDSDDLTAEGIGAACRYQQLDNHAKKLFIVDSGLAFNSPYPLLLRPQRAVDIYLSFDFSMRKTDNTLPFKELILAEKWACQNKVPFPPVEKLAEQYRDDGYVREVYVFKNEDDPFCPVILHFPLVNHHFRSFKAPGELRTTDEELDFANFKIFDDKTNVYASTNFVYEDIQFNRLTKLTEFNTLHCLETIKDELALAVQRKKENIVKRQLGINDVASLLSRVKSLRHSRRENGMRLSVAPDREMRLLTMLKTQDRPADAEPSSGGSDYSDAVEFQDSHEAVN
ncbi:cytosolic phospholipase A2 isoform X2 [Hyalella azteca]|uniref:Phospholipase A2 n=1 Tax=Hyalella azteca TaxID=294128 RepID=A0A8B7NDS2_HYAAZ|nr:cytosolic phospholipase A2 isoform X2 [Hyalella azteca]